jgi:hypothetical protein
MAFGLLRRRLAPDDATSAGLLLEATLGALPQDAKYIIEIL